jgi:hypothetical protein
MSFILTSKEPEEPNDEPKNPKNKPNQETYRVIPHEVYELTYTKCYKHCQYSRLHFTPPMVVVAVGSDPTFPYGSFAY